MKLDDLALWTATPATTRWYDKFVASVINQIGILAGLYVIAIVVGFGLKLGLGI